MWGGRGKLDRNVEDEEGCAETESEAVLYILSGLCDDGAIDAQSRNRPQQVGTSIRKRVVMTSNNPTPLEDSKGKACKVLPISPLPSEQSGPKIAVAPKQPHDPPSYLPNLETCPG